MSILLLGVRLLLAAVFGVAGVAKLLDYEGTRKSLVNFGLPEFLSRPSGLLLPLAELICAIALIPDHWAMWGAYGIALLLVVFILGISITLAQGRRPDCHCFGQLHSTPVSWKTLVRNFGLLALAGLVLWKNQETTRAQVVAQLTRLSTFQSVTLAVVAALAIVAVLELWFLLHVLRQNGRLLLRLEAVEAKLNIEAPAPPPPGLPVGTPAPDFFLKSLDGKTVTLGTLRESATPLLLVFSGPDCGACDAMLPQLAIWKTEHVERLRIVPISKGNAETNRAKYAKHGIHDVLLQSDNEVSEAYLVTGTPSAVLLVNGVIDSPLATGQNDIQDLVTRATLPPRVEKGELVPALRLRDLKGETVELNSFNGRKTMVLFWSPSCGFCDQMLNDVKSFERNPPKDAPELLIISSGSAESNRAQGFRSQVLLDQNFGAGSVLGSAGTPSAVLIDEQGRIASDVSVGAAEVLALAGVAPQKTLQ